MIAWWSGITQGLQQFVIKCRKCQVNRPSLGKTVSKRPEANVWERLHINWGYSKDQYNILVIVNAGWGWIEVLPNGNRTPKGFEIPYTLVSDSGPEFLKGDLKRWCKSLGNEKIESAFYHPRADELVERAIQTMKRALQAWIPKLKSVIWGIPSEGNDDTSKHFKDEGQKSGWTTSGTQIETTSNIRFRFVQTHSIQGQCKDEHNSCYFDNQEGLEPVFVQLENSTGTILVSDKEIARLVEDAVKTEQPVQENMSQSESQVQNADVGPLHQDEASAATSIAEHRQSELSECSRNSTRHRN